MRAFWLCATLIALTGCATPTSELPEQLPAAVTYFPTPTRLPTHTPLPSPTPTATSAPTSTPIPTQMPTPTSTPTPMPRATPTLALVPLSAPTPTATPLPVIPPTLMSAPSPTAESSCPRLPATYSLVTFISAPYKDNALTDLNPDLRLSVLGLEPTDAPSVLVDYDGTPDPDSPKISQILRAASPAIGRTYLRYDWAWEYSTPPYGRRTALNREWPAAALELLTPTGAWVYPPARRAPIDGEGSVAMVLFAAEREIALGYTRSDSVEAGYVIYVLNLCVSPDLVALYRAQLADGRRATGHLPAVRADQPIGVSFGSIIVAVRDRGTFLDPRARADWW